MAKNTTLTFSWETVFKGLLIALAISLLAISLAGVYRMGFTQGFLSGKASGTINLVSYDPSPTPFSTPTPTIGSRPSSDWGGPELWSAVNARREELGVNPLSQKDELCTIASIRLSELLELGRLDGHEGFSSLRERRSDLAWIFDKYSTIAEYLAVGGDTPEETIDLWENTDGSNKLLNGGEYVWGCIYAEGSFSVAITAF